MTPAVSDETMCFFLWVSSRSFASLEDDTCGLGRNLALVSLHDVILSLAKESGKGKWKMENSFSENEKKANALLSFCIMNSAFYISIFCFPLLNLVLEIDVGKVDAGGANDILACFDNFDFSLYINKFVFHGISPLKLVFFNNFRQI